MQKKWWMESVGYQIYPKSFFDSNGDGIGDLKGIEEKLDYLDQLGVDLLWICPFYDSPMDDNGYDVRDFREVSPLFGSMEDVKSLIAKAKEKGMRILLDLVLNHTSDEHPWFIESRKSKDNPYRDYYLWHDGKWVDGLRKEPTNWGSFFGGSAWEYDVQSDSFYMKIFSKKMPDLNWSNPKVRDEMAKIASLWIDDGIDGFRIDAVSHLDRAPLEDSTYEGEFPLDWFKFSNLPKVHLYLNELHDKVFIKNDVVTIGEVGGEASIEEGLKYASYDSRELSMVFHFDHNWCNNLHDVHQTKEIKVNLPCLKNAFFKWQDAFKDKGWLPLYWLNHDHPRLISHYGSEKDRTQSGKMLATLLHFQRGTPFIYQGEEIGMMNYPFEDIKEINDVSTIAAYRRYLMETPDDPVLALRKAVIRSRDQARTPMQWSEGPYAGFSTSTPYLSPHPNYKKINVKKEMNTKGSLWRHYQHLIQLRKHSDLKDIIVYGDFHPELVSHPDLFCYRRTYQNQSLFILCSFSKKRINVDLKAYQMDHLIVSNHPKNTIRQHTLFLEPYGAVVYRLKEEL